MSLLGEKVRHICWGCGTVIACNGDHLDIGFSSRTSTFRYPDAFEKFVRFENEDIQTEALKSIENKRNSIKPQLQVRDVSPDAIEKKPSSCQTSMRTSQIRDIDTIFSADYHASYLSRQPILTYTQVEEQFGIRITGFGRGINVTPSKVVLISSVSRANGNFVYHDKWTAEGDYIYSGEGKSGDQMMTKGNLAIKDAEQGNKEIHLFVKFSPKEYYYQGVFKLIDYTYEDEQDESGFVRKEFKFRLRRLR